MMITTGRNKRRLITHPLHQLETEHVAVESEGAFKISDFFKCTWPILTSGLIGSGGMHHN